MNVLKSYEVGDDVYHRESTGNNLFVITNKGKVAHLHESNASLKPRLDGVIQ